MKKFLLFAALVIASLSLTAANVDLATAQQSAQRFLMSQTAKGRFMTSAPAIKWTHEVKNSSNAAQTAYYIVNTDKGYVIVSGDDRARTVLAYGDGSLEDMNNIPDNMQFFLDMYKAEMEYLQAHPGQVVKTRSASRGESVAPMLSTLWQQGSTNGRSPYNRLCPQTGGSYCLVGCAAVSMAQVMNFWKYPAGSPALPAYVGTRGVAVPALPAYTFDWNNMLNKYENSNWTEAQRDAIANLMRYVGQALFMDYDPNMSGADEDQMLMAVRLFGFDSGAHYLLKNGYDHDMTELVNDEDWNATMQSELAAGRPLMYCAASATSDGGSFYGHAFNVEGYDASNDTYHVNFGQSEERNGYYAFNAFGYGITVYKYFQLMFVGMQPPAQGVPVPPRIVANPVYNYLETHAGWSTTADIHVIGLDLTDDITVTVHDENGYHTANVSKITRDELDDANHKVITVTYAPEQVGTHTATITLTNADAEEKVVTIVGEATLDTYVPVMLPAAEAYVNLTQFRADWTDQTADKYVASYTLKVNTKPATALLEEADWSDLPTKNGNQASNAQEYMPEGWVFNGSGFWLDGASIEPSSGSTVTTQQYDLTGYDKVTVLVTFKSWSSYTAADLTVSTSVDSKTFTGTTSFTQYTAVLNCADAEEIVFTAGYYPMIQNIKIYGGELDAVTLRAIVEEGNATERLITGITDKNYTVKNLEAGGTFYYKVKAVYTDGTESAWSNTQMITLFENGHGYQLGDVNHDGEISIKDVTDLLNYLVTGDGDVCGICADMNADGEIAIVDATALLNYLLTGE